MTHKLGAAFFCISATMLAVLSPARAETISLNCGSFGYFSVDLANSTVNNVPARIDQTAIDWQVTPTPASDGTTGVNYFHIDRVSGVMTQSATYHTPSGEDIPGGGSTQSCTAGAAPQTKF